MATHDEFLRLVDIMSSLRGENGCPWDKEQTHETIRPYCIEEAYEVVQAIDDGDRAALKEELGDLLLQVVFHSQMAKEAGHFTIQDVLQTLNDKLVRRHPHVFERSEKNDVKDAKEVLERWAELKKKEGRKSTLDGVPKNLPALLCATRMGEKAANIGFDWAKSEEVAVKVNEELLEIASAKTQDHKEEEFGDLLFTLCHWARHEGIDAETALRGANAKFDRRFRRMEELAQQKVQKMSDLSLPELESLWSEAKRSS